MDDLDAILQARREQYEQLPLDVGDVDPDPVEQVRRWTAEWAEVAPREPAAAVLATADGRRTVRRPQRARARPSTTQGCAFFTNYESRKGRHLAANRPRARCSSAGCRCSARSSSWGRWRQLDAGRERGLLRHAPARQPDRGVGVGPVDRAARPGRARGRLRRRRGALRRRARALPAPLGWLPARARTRSSSGRAAPTASTTACATPGTPAPRRAGASSASAPDPGASGDGLRRMRPGVAAAARPRTTSAVWGIGAPGGQVGPVRRPAAHAGRQLELHARRRRSG